MRMKLHRSRRVFRGRRSISQLIVWLVIALVVVTLSFFGTKHILERPATPDKNDSSSQAPVSSTPDETESTVSANTTQTPDGTTPEPIHGFYIPTVALQDTVKLKNTLQKAADAGFTHVVFDIKDSDGKLYYRSETARAVQANVYADGALPLEHTKNLFSVIRECGLKPIPRLYAFMDNKASRMLSKARITPQGNPGWVWYDGDPKNGGRAWLNPYTDEAQLYIIELAKELRDLGAAGIMLDGVQFPKQTASADFGSSTLSRDKVLSDFVSKTRTILGDSCPVMLSCTANSALGTDTVVYGGNPITFTAANIAPMLLTGSMPSAFKVGNESITNTPDTLTATVKALVNQLELRIKVMPQEEQPTLTPWLQASDYTPSQIKSAIQGCIDGGATDYILYNATGVYDFAALK